MPRSHRASPKRRSRPLAVLACLVLALAAAVVQPDSARAVATNPFVINGSGIPDAGAVQLDDLFGNVKELGPKNASTTKIGVIHKAATPMLDKTNPNAQVDLRRAWLDLARDSGNNDWVYFAWERDSNSGSGFIAFEFMANGIPTGCSDYAATDAQLIAGCNPWKDRQAGDFLVLWDQSGSSTSLYKRVWQQSGSNLVLGSAQAITNGVAAFSPDHFKGEAAINITAEGLSDPGGCVSFANVIPSTVTGNSDTADYKDTILQKLDPISNCEADLATTPKDGAGNDIPEGGLSIGTGVVSVKDSATISLSGGASTPTGAISFELCKVGAPATCTDVGSTSVAGGSYPKTVLSPVAYVTAAGDYCWSTSWPGDADNGIPPASDSSANECFTVNPVDSSLSTSAGADVVLGNGVSDSATLSGTATQPADPVINTTGTAGAPAGGTITFKLYGPSGDGCGELVYTSPTVAVSGDDTYDTPAPLFEPDEVGAYHWVAVYSGSPNTNGTSHNTACDDADEDVSVDDVPSTLSTSQSWVPNDSATVSADAGGDLAGTVTFEFFDNGTCTGDPVWSEDVPVAGASDQTVSTSNEEAVDASGDFSWRVSYDSDNVAQRDIPSSCDEVSGLTIDNGGSHTSP
ncbi:MAG TPA: hypothetical protein VM575_01950 [Nocardioides sp.]|jgi:hypothetical protein|nr:hypothetical protein [Nocardioides sp.]